jgi:hypothetical protein
MLELLWVHDELLLQAETFIARNDAEQAKSTWLKRRILSTLISAVLRAYSRG